MAAHPSIRRLGFQGREVEIADSFRRAMLQLGRSHAEAMSVLGWYSRTFGTGAKLTMVDLSLAFDVAAKQHNWSPEITNAAYGWNAALAGSGGDPSVIRSP